MRLLAAILLASLACAQTYRAPRLAGTQRPNLNGLWQAMNEGNWDIQAHDAQPGPPQFGALYAQPGGVGIVEGNELPYQPWAIERKKANFANRFTLTDTGGRLEPLDPEAKCHLPGIPRANYMPFPFQITQGTNKILFSYEFASASRIVHMDKVDPAPAASYMGWSVGRWEADTLAVDVNAFNDRTWFDRAGNFHSDAMRVAERITPASADVLRYEATIDDPKIFTRPWKMSFPIYRRLDKGAQLLEFKCVPFAEELVYGHLRKK
jgi:hypothetical protein